MDQLSEQFKAEIRMTFFSLSHLHPAPVIGKKIGCLRWRKTPKMKRKEISGRLMELKAEMEEISEEQKMIKEGQRRTREKFEAIEEECEQLRKETKLMILQSTHTQLRLTLMFKILKAREQGDLTKAAQLTQLLRAIIARTTSNVE